MSTPAIAKWRVNITTLSSKIRQSNHRVKLRTRRALSHSKDGWKRLTAGMEINDLWAQFRVEAAASSRLYKNDVNWNAVHNEKSWKQPFKIAAAIFWSILAKLSPARRLFLLLTLVLAFMSLTHIQFFFLTQEIEFFAAFVGVLILLVLVLGDHITMKRDIEIAREIQRWLVPRVPPNVAGVDMAFSTRPATTVAGDYYDVFRRATDGPLLIAVADVAGKGVPAAMLMATFQASLRALAGARGTLAELVTGLNRQVCATSLNGRRFTTAFLAELEPVTGELSYLCAGHNPPLLRHADGSFELLKSDSIPLGIELTESYKTGKTTFEPGGLLVIYTDGVTEARNEEGLEYGEKRLLALLENPPQERASITLASILKDLDEFVGGAAQHDDITCLVVRRNLVQLTEPITVH